MRDSHMHEQNDDSFNPYDETHHRNVDARRERWLRHALNVELASIVWISLEAILSGLAAWSVGSLALSAFSVDSAIEWISGAVLFLRIAIEYFRGEDRMSAIAERIASGIVGLCLIALAAYISFKSGQSFAVRTTVELSYMGWAVAATSSLVTPALAVLKKRLGTVLHSHALMADAACSFTCAYMSWTLMAGMLLQWLFGWWWLDAVMALGVLYFVIREGLESLQSAWTGEAHAH